MAKRIVARVSVGITNLDPVALMDVARRQLDYLGPPGIRAKRDQTDDLYREQGSLGFSFKTMEMFRRFEERVIQNCDSAIKIDLEEKP